MHREPQNGLGPWEALSQRPDGRYLSTRHWTEARARKRLAGNSRHRVVAIINHSPKAAQAPELTPNLQPVAEGSSL